MNNYNKFNLERFLDIQNENFEKAFEEIKNNKKVSHWMWYVFPQIDLSEFIDLTSTSRKYSISSIEEAIEYLKNPTLKKNLIKITEELLKKKEIKNVFNKIDFLKLKSCMTLFESAYNKICKDKKNKNIFSQVLEKFYNNERCKLTKLILIKQNI